MVHGMKTTVELPDALLIEAKQKAAELRRPLKSLIEEGLRNELQMLNTAKPKKKKEVSRDNVPIKEERPDSSSHEKMHDWLNANPFIGMWKDREEMSDVETYIHDIRKGRFA
jgi:phage terminase large subunit-like protein